MLRAMARPRFDLDYYAVLGVGPQATEDEIRRAYRRLALQWHPDRNAGDRRAEERFKQISEAYAVLIAPDKRSAYDTARQGGVRADFGPSREDLFRDLFADPRASAIFEELAREFERLGLRVERRDFRETLFGGRAVFTGRVVMVTPFTPGRLLASLARAVLRGPRPAAGRAVTSSPGGVLGRLLDAGRHLLGLAAAPGEGGDLVVPLALTPAEAAEGGRKRITLARDGRHEDVVVTVPRGVRAGTRLRLRGKGRPHTEGRPGDAYLVVEILGGRPAR
jgi:DnaJ-class molecular chaperone